MFDASVFESYYDIQGYHQYSDDQTSDSYAYADILNDTSEGELFQSLFYASVESDHMGVGTYISNHAELTFSFVSSGPEWLDYDATTLTSGGEIVATIDGNSLLTSNANGFQESQGLILLSPGAHQLLFSTDVNTPNAPDFTNVTFNAVLVLATPEPSPLLAVFSLLGLSCLARNRHRSRLN